MQILIHQQVNIISAIVLLLFWMYACSVLDKKSYINKIYLVSLSLNLILIVLEVTFNIIVKMDSISIFFPRVIGGLIFALSPLLAYQFLQFVCYYFSTPYKIKRSIKTIFAVLIFLNSIVAISSFKSKMFIESIRITEYTVPFSISLIFLVYSAFTIFKNKKTLINFEYIYIITICIITSVLVLAQFIASETRFIWCSSTFTVILMFIVLQQRELYRDPLTGARNRLVLKKCLDAHAKKAVTNLSVVMIDLDYFKNINDSFGHSEGDYALRVFVRLLQKVYSENGIVIRMGGDEFLVLIYGVSTLEVNELIKKMSKMVDKFNNKGIKPYRIKYSCASGTYNNSDISIDQFIHEIDMKMYQNKNGRKGKMWSVENL
jgi:diguanylate cyclase (GGDEF)-like protein